MPTLQSSSELIEGMRTGRVLPDATANSTLAGLQDLPDDPVHAASQLVQRGLITSFQAKMLLAGKFRGFRLGDYIIREAIGTGGMGSVYLGVHQTLERKVAIKVLHPKVAGDQLAIQRFLREAKVAASLDHPNIVRLNDVGKQGSVRYLTMEYVEGETLDKQLERGPVAVSRAVQFIAQAAAGLQHAYEKGIVHRDIKPGNLIIGRDGTLKILDMGLAKPIDQNDSPVTAILDAGAVVGTADFISPEQALNEVAVDIRSDIYSLGATFYALVTGRPPFHGNTANKLINHQMKDPPPLTEVDKTFPAELSKIIAKMMAKKPADRFSTPADVLAALEPWLNDDVSVTVGIAKTEAGSRGSLSTKRLGGRTSVRIAAGKQSSKLWIGIGGAAAAIVFAGGLIGWWLASGTKKPIETAVATNTPSTPIPSVTPSTPSSMTDSKPAAPLPSWTSKGTITKLDLTSQQPFERLVGAVSSSTDPSKSTETLREQRGKGDWPAGWSLVTWQPGHEARGFSAVTEGGPVLGLEAKKGNAMLFFTLNDSLQERHVVVRMEYQSTCQTEKLTLRLRQMGSTTTVNRTVPLSADWVTKEFLFEADKVTEPRFEFHDQDATPGAILRIRKFEVLAVTVKPAS